MPHGVLHQRLQQERGQAHRRERRIGVEAHLEAVREAHLLELEVPAQELQLVAERRHPGAAFAEDVAEKLGEPRQHGHRVLAPAFPREHGCRVEDVEKKVRIQLGAQRREARFQKARLELERVRLALAQGPRTLQRLHRTGDGQIEQQVEDEMEAEQDADRGRDRPRTRTEGIDGGEQRHVRHREQGGGKTVREERPRFEGKRPPPDEGHDGRRQGSDDEPGRQHMGEPEAEGIAAAKTRAREMVLNAFDERESYGEHDEPGDRQDAPRSRPHARSLGRKTGRVQGAAGIDAANRAVPAANAVHGSPNGVPAAAKWPARI